MVYVTEPRAVSKEVVYKRPGYRKKVVPRINFALYIFVKGFFDNIRKLRSLYYKNPPGGCALARRGSMPFCGRARREHVLGHMLFYKLCENLVNCFNERSVKRKRDAAKKGKERQGT